MKKETLNAIKKICGALLLCCMLGTLVQINATEIAKDREAAAKKADAAAAVTESSAGAAAEAPAELAKYAACTYFRNFSMETMDGGSFGTEDLKDYKITVINAWGPYCSSCIAEMPALESISSRYKDKGLQIVGLYAEATTDDADDMKLAEQKVIDTGVTYPILIGNEAFDLGARDMLNSALPGTWILDSQGNVLDFQASGRSEALWEELFNQWLAYAENN